MEKIEMLKKILMIFLILLNLNCKGSLPQSGMPDGVYANLNNDTLRIGNNLAGLEFEWNNGNLILLTIINKNENLINRCNTNSTVFRLGNETEIVNKSNFEVETVPSTLVSNEYLEVSVFAEYDKVELKRIFRIYPDSPLIGIDFYLKLKGDQKLQFESDDAELLSLNLYGNHWKYKSVEFFDRTDENNNLVDENDILGYKLSKELRGNILVATDLINNKSLIILKEAPCSSTQLHYPGYDFSCRKNSVKVTGIGLSPGDLEGNSWIRLYGFAIGLTGSAELDYLTAIRKYQKKLRKSDPSRDEMIMMNTWGDRNKDASIGEQFIVKELDACEKLSVSHFQIDDGWQQGQSKNSASSSGKLWNTWTSEDWQPDSTKFPNGFKIVVDYAKKKNIKLGLWFHPSNENSYAQWHQDAKTVTTLYKMYDIRYFKIDGIKIPDKMSEINLRKFFNKVLEETDYMVCFNLDATADNRGGYHFLNEYGNIFLENRYTDFGNYYPYTTLRNLWMLSKYVAPEKIQIEFLNKWRNSGKYPAADVFAPGRIPFDYQFAISMMGQPLAWFEGSGLPGEAFEISPLIKKYRDVQHDIHNGLIFPIGDEPNGSSWTGFQSISDDEGYFLIFREYNNSEYQNIKTHLSANAHVKFRQVLGVGEDFSQVIGEDQKVKFKLPGKHTFTLYKYKIINI